jgi:hypothetical protein
VRFARRVAQAVAIVGWLYGWFLLRGVRSEYAVGDLGAAPRGLLLLLILTTFVAIATAVAAASRVPAWPYMAIATAILIATGILLAQYFPLRDYAVRHGGISIDFGEVVTVALRNRSPAGVVISTAIPTLLLFSGLSGLILRMVPPPSPARPNPTRPPGGNAA